MSVANSSSAGLPPHHHEHSRDHDHSHPLGHPNPAAHSDAHIFNMNKLMQAAQQHPAEATVTASKALAQLESAGGTDKPGDSASVVPGFYAGLAKALATKSAFTATAVSKGLLKWWFRFPVKLFRPVAVNPWLVFNSMAQKEGKKVSVKYVRDVVADEGWGVLGKNMMPLLVANACVGALLFNVYGGVTDYMEAQGSFHYHTPFVAGFLAGGAQAALATPLDNMQRHVNPADIVERRHEGIIRFTYNTIRQTLPSGFWASTKFLYTGLGFTAFKDALGFSMFFGVFEGVRHVGKSLVAEFFNSHVSLPTPAGILQNIIPIRPPTEAVQIGAPAQGEQVVVLPTFNALEARANQGFVEMETEEELQRRRSLTFTLLNALAVITAGAAAGMAYQVVIFPVENIRAMIGNAAAEAAVSNGDCGNTAKMRAERHMSLRDVVRLLRNEGFKPFYSGILPHLIRVMPPSALGLLAYEIASSQFFDNEDSLEN